MKTHVFLMLLMSWVMSCHSLTLHVERRPFVRRQSIQEPDVKQGCYILLQTLQVYHLFWLSLFMVYRGNISNWMWMCLWSPTRGSQSNAKTIANYCVKTCYSFTADSSDAAGSNCHAKWQYSMEIHFWLLMI